MADFEQAVNLTLEHEGGYASDPADPGGETKYGISHRSYPQLDIKSLTIEDAKAIYKRDFWRYDGLDSQLIANKVFDLGVNCGAKTSVEMLQQALVDSGHAIEIDGNFGPITLASTNAADPEWILNSLKKYAVDRYQHLVAADPVLAKFLKGWELRAMSTLLLAFTLTSWIPKPVDTLAPLRFKTCFMSTSDILTVNSEKTLLLRHFLPCWKCHRYRFCIDTSKGQE